MTNSNASKEWIIQRCINVWKNVYEVWPGYCEELLTREEMLTALCECEEKYPEHEFRGHNILNQKCGDGKIIDFPPE